MGGWADVDSDAFAGARIGALVRFAYALTGDLGLAVADRGYAVAVVSRMRP